MLKQLRNCIHNNKITVKTTAAAASATTPTTES